ncbi:MAG: antitoxin [Thermoplasmata archaeon HGW-Thermoplasmata-1]|nr:MAG: antitoxin [Thermoplasmata archaeon HGW-Thermoplasmata-1]
MINYNPFGLIAKYRKFGFINKHGGIMRMVQAVVTLDEREDRVVNLVKAMFGLNNKSDAVRLIIDEYGKEVLEPELRPEFIEKMNARQKEPTVQVKDFKKHFGLS